MSFANLTGSGNGYSEYRLQIEAFDYGFVTNGSMAKTSSGVTYLNGLLREGLRIDYSVDLENAKLEAQSNQFVIVDLSEAATEAFVRTPSWEAKVTEPISLADTTIHVSNAKGRSAGDIIFVGTEAIQIGTIDDATDDVQLVDCTRGVLNSTQQTHPFDTQYGINNAQLLSPSFTDIPVLLQNRKVKLYGYGMDDDPQGNGTLIWRGIVQAEPKLVDGGKYKLAAYPITERLKTEVGANFGKIKLRGINHPTGDDALTPTINSNHLHIKVYRRVSNEFDSADIEGESSAWVDVQITGFYETRELMLDEMNNQLYFSGGVEGWTEGTDGTMPRFGWMSNGALGLFFNSGADNKCFIAYTFNGIGGEDPRHIMHEENFNPHRLKSEGKGLIPVSSFTQAGEIDSVSSEENPFVTSTESNRSYCQPVLNTDDPYPSIVSVGKTFYLDIPRLPDDALISVAIINNENEHVYQCQVSDGAIDAVNRTLTIDRIIPPVREDGRPVVVVDDASAASFLVKDESHEIILGLKLAEGSLVDLLQSLASYGPLYGAATGLPVFDLDDFDLAGITTLFETLQTTAFHTERVFQYFDTISIEDMIAEECKSLGVVPGITTSGQFTLTKLRFASSTENRTISMGPSVVLTDRNFPEYNRGALKARNVALLKLDYDVVEQEHARELNFNYTDSIQLIGKTKVWEVAPVSQTKVPFEVGEVENIIMRPLVIFGLPITTVSFDVPMNRFHTLLGSAVSITNNVIPDRLTSTRGVTDLVGIVKSIQWDLNECRGKITMYTKERSFRGYSPSAHASGDTATNLGGNRWFIPLKDNEYSYSSELDGDYFLAGEEVEWMQEDSWTKLSASGTIGTMTNAGGSWFVDITFYTAVNNLITSTNFSGAVMRYTNMKRTELTARQKQFAWISSGSTVGPVFEDKTTWFGP